MAAAASSVGRKRFDVFLSFRGIDTRRTFTSHLYSAFNRKGIVTFMDSALDRGEKITPTILKAIEESNVSVIIFSKNYASSPCCLDELVKIIECMRTHGQKVLPVFYEVDPADVGKQTAGFGDVFADYEEAFKGDMGKVQRWRTALTEAAYISGWDSRNTSSDSELIEEIVKDILKIIRHLSSCHFGDLVGIESQVEQIESLLCIGAEDVRVIGIWGMGGIGKTAIAKLVFEKFASHFQASCFLENIREASSTRHGLVNKWDELVKKLLNIGILNSDSSILMSRLHCTKVLIVVDDVDNFEQLELLVGKHCWFGAGSRIIVTSRDKQVLQNKVDKIYEVQVLSPQESLQLFSLFAFKEEQPKAEYIELSKRVVSYVNGIPLALKVLGSFLYGRSKQEWKSALDRLGKTPNMQVQKVLRISYDGLDHDEQEMFLDIACFFKGWSLFFMTKLFESCGYYSLISLRVLADKTLIILRDSKVEMHDLLQEMGRQIVRQESIKDPGKRSRLWDPEDIQYVLEENVGTEEIEGMFLDQCKISGCRVDSKVFNRTKRLKWLNFYSNNSWTNGIKWLNLSNTNCGHDMQFPQGLESLPNQLRFLQWDFFPLKSLPSNFQPDNLVFLSILSSPVERLWDGVQNLANLSVIELCHCRHLTEMPDLSRAQNLSTMDCRSCINLREVIEQKAASGRCRATLKTFSFVNRAKLDQKTEKDISDDFLKTVKLFAGAVLLLTEGFPGGEVIDDYESIGSSVTIQLPPNWFSSNFMGFSVNVFLTLEDKNKKEIDNDLGVRWTCRYKSECGEIRVASALYQYLPPTYIKSGNFLMYGWPTNLGLIFDQNWLQENWCNEACFEATIEHSSAKTCYQVKKMVAKLMYMGDNEGNPTQLAF
ncbi:disease resistance protein RPV1-like isoform X3 [Euphorbia lathyris]|uniref:disease resistance protein RPV1-like isoform X3 n=1 Tax=Euphorbia lathyris TaxID=212925 RepID=UPI003313C20B